MINRSLSRLAVSYCRQIQERQLSFHLTDTQREIQATALQFAQEELLPAAPHHDRTGEFPWELINKAHDLGLRNPQIPEEYGGPGLSTLDAVLIKEALSFGCSGLQMAIMGPFLAVNPLLIAGNEQQKKRYLCELATEPCVASYCVTETNAGSDVNGVKTTAVRKGDEYVINGSKCWITGGGHARWFYVLARTAEDPATPAGKAFSAFIVDGDSPGIERGSKESMMGQRCSDTRTITFEDVRVPIANRVGGEGDGFKITMAAFDATRPCIAAGALGIAWRALSESTAYSIERKTFGQPIASHQAISSKLADMATNLELARLATYRAAVEIDSGGSNASYFASMAKNFAAKIASEASANAVQIFGGNGFSCDFPVEKLMRDSKIYEIYGGTNEAGSGRSTPPHPPLPDPTGNHVEAAARILQAKWNCDHAMTAIHTVFWCDVVRVYLGP